MEVRSLQAPIISGIPSGLTQIGLKDKQLLFVCGQRIKIPNFKNHPDSRKLKLVGTRAQASGTTKLSSKEVEAASKVDSSKDENLVFVAGATGKVGSRTVRELLKLGFKVRAGVRSAQRAEPLLQSVRQMKLDADVKPIEKLEIVECDLERPDQIGPALGNASVVICCIGASEKEVFDITGPYRIDYQATKNLVDAATAAKANHFILLTSLGTNKFGFPAAILNLFWGVLCWKRKAEEALLESGLTYTIVRPGGMERPTDAYKETHNITLSEEDTLFGGQVSNLQVAELLAFMAKSRSLSYCKVVEVIAETTAPLTPLGDLLARIPSQRVEIKPPKVPVAVEPQPVAPSVPSPPEPPATAVEEEPAKAATAPSVPVTPEPPVAAVVEEPAKAEKKGTSSLSPYFMYEDLKPPTSPTPTPSTSPAPTKTSNIEAVPAETKSIEIEKEDIEIKVIKKSPQSPYTAYEDLKPPTSPIPTPSGPKEETVSASTAEVVSEIITGGNDVAKITTEDVVEKSLPQSVNSYQSPYYAYEDLKPPTSPSPTPSGPKEVTVSASTAEVVSEIITGGNDVAKVTTEDVVEKSLPQSVNSYQSPYYAYADLKPPTSPTPSPSGPKEVTPITPIAEVAEQVTEDTVVPEATEIAVEEVTKTPISHQSPFHAYEDLKPPTSPSPSAPTGTIPSQSSPNGASAPATIPETDVALNLPADKPEDGPKPRPLSPFTMYDDLKPPVSPGPPRI